MAVTTLDSDKKKNAFKFQRHFALLNHYLRPQMPRVVLMSVLLLAGIALQLASPQIIRYFLDTAQQGGGQPGSMPVNLVRAALLFILAALAQQALIVLAGTTSQRVSWSATNRLRGDLTLHLLRLDMTFHKQHTPGELIERVEGDVTALANFFSSFVVNVIGNGLLVMGILILLFRENLVVGLGMLAYTLITLAALGAIQGLGVPRWAASRQASAEQYGFLEERISGAEEIRTAGAEAHTLTRLYSLMRNFLHKSRAAFVVSSLASSLTNLLYVIGYAIGLAFGVHLFGRGEATLGTAYLITHYVGMLSSPLQSLRHEAQDLQSATASIQRIEDLLNLRPSTSEVELAQQSAALPDGALSVAFEQVSFHYEDNENVLNNLCFALPAGKVLGVLGRTGSGKSTLTRLLFRLYDPSEGCIRLSETDLRTVPIKGLRGRVGMVTQDVQLFQVSLRDNLTFFNPAVSDAQLEAVLKDLRLWDWVQSQPAGLHTRMSAGGQGLSAGEAQLLAFARVFLKDPGLVILDEASSRLDPVTETLMERAVERLFVGRTGIIIAHRLKTVQRADDILILEDGRVVEYGPRVALVQDSTSRFYSLLQTGLEEALA